MSDRLEILLVDDDLGDARLVREALRERDSSSSLTVVHDGAAALAYLRREPPYEGASRPGLVLLDLNLPRVNGLEVLRAIKSDPRLAGVAVVVLTVSSSEDDVHTCRSLRADGYARKPLGIRPFFRLLELLEDVYSDPSTQKESFRVFESVAGSAD